MHIRANPTTDANKNIANENVSRICPVNGLITRNNEINARYQKSAPSYHPCSAIVRYNKKNPTDNNARYHG